MAKRRLALLRDPKHSTSLRPFRMVISTNTTLGSNLSMVGFVNPSETPPETNLTVWIQTPKIFRGSLDPSPLERGS